MPRPARRNPQQRARSAHGLTRRARRCARDLNFPRFSVRQSAGESSVARRLLRAACGMRSKSWTSPWAFTNPPAPAGGSRRALRAKSRAAPHLRAAAGANARARQPLRRLCAGAPSHTAGRVSRSQLQLAAVTSLAIGRRLGTRGRRGRRT